MILRPRKFKYKNRHKKRDNVKVLTANPKLIYGQHGLMLLQPIKLYSKQIFRFKLFLKKGAKRVDKTKRAVWFNMFPHLPLTKKVSGSRMGKGKGKLAGWVTIISPKVNIFEFKNLRLGRAMYFANQFSSKLRVKTRFISVTESTTSYIYKSSKLIKSEIFW